MMSKRKILLISPTPTHPQNAGNRKRVYNLSGALLRLGFEVHFMFVELEKGDKHAMNSYWKNNVYYFSSQKKRPAVPSLTMIRGCLYRFCYSCDERRYNFHIDDWYDKALDAFVINLQKKEKFDSVIVEYVFLSKILLNFEDNVLKVLDTHDVFTNRFRIYLEHNLKPQWFSTYAKEEAKALNRADVAIAIQQSERDYFSSLSLKKIVQVGHILNGHAKPNETFGRKILFVASPNPINVDAMHFFVENVMGKLKKKYPDVQLVVAGKLCSLMEERDDIILLGEFDNQQDVYQKGDIVVNPVRFGTGLNIKTIEALSCGKALVASTAGSAGLETQRGKAFLVADTDRELLEAISRIIDDKSLRQKLVNNAVKFIEEYNRKNLKELEKALA